MPRTVVLVEGESDRVALQTLACRLDIDIDGREAELVVMNGVTNLRRHLAETGEAAVVLLHDIGEAAYVDRALARCGGPAPARFACDLDLEDELVRSLGVPGTLAVIDAAGDLPKWETLVAQPHHRDRPEAQVLRRFFGTTSGRKARYAQLLVDALDLDRVPEPLAGALAAVVSRGRRGA